METVSAFKATLYLHVFSRLARASFAAIFRLVPTKGRDEPKNGCDGSRHLSQFASGLLSSVPIVIGQIESEMLFASGMLIKFI